MKINNISFCGIRLYRNDAKSAHRTISYLNMNGYDFVGQKKYYCANKELKDKHNKANYIRMHYPFEGNEFGLLLFPWVDETYILADPKVEQKMLEFVQEMDYDAYINLMI